MVINTKYKSVQTTVSMEYLKNSSALPPHKMNKNNWNYRNADL
jgi:hypothetical protein